MNKQKYFKDIPRILKPLAIKRRMEYITSPHYTGSSKISSHPKMQFSSMFAWNRTEEGWSFWAAINNDNVDKLDTCDKRIFKNI